MSDVQTTGRTGVRSGSWTNDLAPSMIYDFTMMMKIYTDNCFVLLWGHTVYFFQPSQSLSQWYTYICRRLMKPKKIWATFFAFLHNLLLPKNPKYFCRFCMENFDALSAKPKRFQLKSSKMSLCLA